MTDSSILTLIHLLPVHMTSTLPGILDTLGERIKVCSSEINGNTHAFCQAHALVSVSYNQADEMVQRIIAIFREIDWLCPSHIKVVIDAANSTRQLLTVIQMACGDIRNAGCFQATFSNWGTVSLVQSLLAQSSADMRNALNKLTGHA